jgi:16S rRNA G1207 methylase RsmC
MLSMNTNVNQEALRRAQANVPKGEYHVHAEALHRGRQGVPNGEYSVKARAGVYSRDLRDYGTELIRCGDAWAAKRHW